MQIDMSLNKIKFGSTIYTSELYQKKYEALGVEIKKKGNNSTGMGLIVPSQHMKKRFGV